MEQRLGCPVVIGYTSTEAAITTGTVPGDSPEVISQTVGRPRVNVELEVVDDDGRRVRDRRRRARALPLGRGDARLLARSRRARPRCSAPTVGSRPATSASSTSAATSRSSGGAARCTSAAATTSIRPRSSACCRSIRRSRRSPCSAYRIRCSARSASRSSCPRRARRPQLDELRTFCKAALADYKAPDRLVVVDALPLTSVGKVDKRALAEDAALAAGWLASRS